MSRSTCVLKSRLKTARALICTNRNTHQSLRTLIHQKPWDVMFKGVVGQNSVGSARRHPWLPGLHQAKSNWTSQKLHADSQSAGLSNARSLIKPHTHNHTHTHTPTHTYTYIHTHVYTHAYTHSHTHTHTHTLAHTHTHTHSHTHTHTPPHTHTQIYKHI
jgi:hypothetical protein